MGRLRRHLRFSNVASTLAVFLVLAGGTAFAASQLGKNSVGSKQLKKNAVTAAKIKKNAVTGSKIKNAAVTGAKIKAGAVDSTQLADGAVTAGKIDTGSTAFSRVVATLRQGTPVPFTGPLAYPIGTYTQPVGQDIVATPSIEVTFGAGCVAPRIAQAWLLTDPVNPASPNAPDIAGMAFIEDNGTGAVTRRSGFGGWVGGYGSLRHVSPLAPTQRTYFVYPLVGACSSGSGVTLNSASVDILGIPSP